MRNDIPKKDRRPIKIITLDTETRGLEGEIFKIGIFDGKEFFKANSFSDLKEKLLSYTITNNLHIYIHNLKFDFAKMFKDIQSSMIWSESLFINNKPAIIRTNDFTLHDSMQLLAGSSLEKLCDDFKIKDRKMNLIDKLWELKHPAIVMKGRQAVTVYDKKHDRRYKLIREFEQDNKKNIDKRKTQEKYFKTVPADDPLLIEYLEYDCRSLYEIIKEMVKVCPIPLKDFLSCPTAASLSMKVFKIKYEKSYKLVSKGKWIERNNIIEEIMKKGYYGGRTEVFIPKLKVRGYHFDVNSLYPFAMAKKGNLFPIGTPVHLTGLKAKMQWTSYARTGKGGGIITATVHSPENGMIGDYPILPVKYDGKLIFPKGKFEGTWTFPELLFATSRGVKILEIKEIVYFWETADLFSDFVHYFGKLKEENTPNGDPEHDKKCNPSMRQFSKNVLNALYGKFATKRERKSFVGAEEIKVIIDKLEKKAEYFGPEIQYFKDYLEGGEQYAKEKYFEEQDEKVLGRMPRKITPESYSEQIFKYTTYLTSDYIQIQISAYVTSYARIELYKGFENIYHRGGNIYYCDTDSMVTDLPLEKDWIHGTEFGKWEQEGKKKALRAGIFFQPKAYIERYEEINATPETAKFQLVHLHRHVITDGKQKIKPIGPSETRYMNIAQEDETEKIKWVKKFKGVDGETVSNLRMGDMYYYTERMNKRDVDKIELVKKEHGRKNLINTITAIEMNKDPNHMNEIIKSINVRKNVPKRKFDYDNNKSTPWAIDPEHPDFLKKNHFDTKLYNEWFTKIESYNKYDLALEELGKMKIPPKKSKEYEDYKNLTLAQRRKFFGRNGCNPEEYADFISCHPDDLLYDMKWYLRNH